LGAAAARPADRRRAGGGDAGSGVRTALSRLLRWAAAAAGAEAARALDAGRAAAALPPAGAEARGAPCSRVARSSLVLRASGAGWLSEHGCFDPRESQTARYAAIGAPLAAHPRATRPAALQAACSSRYDNSIAASALRCSGVRAPDPGVEWLRLQAIWCVQSTAAGSRLTNKLLRGLCEPLSEQLAPVHVLSLPGARQK
jgi:hypothetical protein